MKKKHPSAIPIAILLVVVAAVVCAGVFLTNRYSESSSKMDGNTYFKVSGDEAAIVLNGQISEEKAFFLDNEAYLPYSFAAQEIYPGFYYDADVSLLCYTTEDNDIKWQLDGADGAFVTGPGGEAYIKLSLISEYFSFDYDIFADPDRIVINTMENIRAARVIKDSPVRFRAGIKSDIIKDLEAGDEVIWLSDIDETWSDVLTYDGYRGYIKSADIALLEEDVSISRGISYGNDFNHMLLPGKVRMAWQYADNDENNALIDDFLAEEKGLNVICPTWISLADDDGNILSRTDVSYVEKAHSAGLYVWVMVDDIDGEGNASAVIGRHAARERLVSALVSEIASVGADGINIDFEALEKSDIPAFMQFLKELTKDIKREMIKEFPDVVFEEEDSLAKCILKVYTETGETFVIIMDEYDVLVRERVDISESIRYLMQGSSRNMTATRS